MFRDGQILCSNKSVPDAAAFDEDILDSVETLPFL